jgi:hypothetical protein
MGSYAEDVAKRSGRDDLHYLGYMEHDVWIANPESAFTPTRVRIQHPGGGTAYALSWQPQKIVESLSGGDKPQILLIGHYHKMGYNFIRNVHCVQPGATQAQTPFMRKKHIASHLGGCIIEFVQAEDGSVLEFTPRFLPFYDTGCTQDGWEHRGV